MDEGEALGANDTFTKYIISSDKGLKITLTVWACKNKLMAQGLPEALQIFVQGFILTISDETSKNISSLIKNSTTSEVQVLPESVE